MESACTTDTSLSIDLAFAPKVSFALHQNSVPVLRELAVVNNGQDTWEELTLSLDSEPAFFRPRVWRLSRLSPEQRYSITDLDLSLDGGQLSRLTEAEKGEVRLAVQRGDRVLCRLERPVELLARNQWGGLGQFPELAAAFVRPNDPAVDRVLKQAAELLRKHGKEPALEGYRTGGKQRAWEIMAAIWGAVCSLGLDYSLPPAGFEQNGQKVRSPEQIIQNGLATCLDLSFLFASCLEQCQLHPLLVFLDGHAFAGAWLVPEVFATTAIDDVSALRKRIQLQEILLFEPTLALRGQQEPAKFKWSCQVGARQVSEEEPRAFQMTLDIARARMERIRPLASEESLARVEAAPATAPEPEEFLDLDEAPDLVEVETQDQPQKPTRPQDRLDRWQRKLLDLSLRNNLLNFRASRRVVELIAPDPGRLEDLLADGKRLKLKPGLRLMQGGDPRDQSIHQARHREEVGREHALDALAKGELFTKLSEDEMDRRLVELFRAARLSLQEGGANTLFLVLGFLVWTQAGKDERRLRAPLILVPVRLDRQSVRGGFSLVLHEDEPRFNLTLLEMLRQDFRLTMPSLEGELSRDDSGLDVAGIWRTVATAIKDLAGWELAEEVSLGQFSFAKYLMWKDLVDRTDQLKENPVVRHLIDTPNQAYGNRSGFVAPQQLDTVLNPADTYCPLPADSSQLSAIMAAANGQDFVLVGPPGTGKSQTIANLIAQCLAKGKTVLFVAEKTAALEVVYRRLRAVGLGEFCLELHSHKANKLEVLRQLKESWDARTNGDWQTWQRECARMGSLRGQLNALVKSLHRPYRNGLSVFVAISKSLAGRDAPVLNLSWQSAEFHDRAGLDELLEIATRLGINAAGVAGAAEAGLGLVTARVWSPGWEAALVTALREMIPLAQDTDRTAQAFLAATGLPALSLIGRGRQALATMAGLLPQAAGRDWSFLLRPDAATIFDRLAASLSILTDRQQMFDQLSLSYRAEAFSQDLGDQRQAWRQAEKTWWPKSYFARRRVRNAVLALAEPGQNKPINCGRDLDLLQGVREHDAKLADYQDLELLTAGLWRGLETQAEQIASARGLGECLSQGLAALYDDPQTLASGLAALTSLVGVNNLLLQPTGAAALSGAEFLAANQRYQAALAELASRMGDDAPSGRYLEDLEPAALADQCQAILAHGRMLKPWCDWNRVLGEAHAKGLGSLAEALVKGDLHYKQARDVLAVNYCRWWLKAAVDADQLLQRFVSAEHEQAIDDFRRLDKKLAELAKQCIRASLHQETPDADDVRKSSEWGLLRRETQKKKRHIPLRQLVENLPTALPTLTPCLLMSPLSIAQYLPPGRTAFDLVVFDEASQIPIWDAIGAMARGQRVVVVGDPKQLPPTNFFNRVEDEEADDEVEVGGDMESILDECNSAGLPNLQLNWHYRSRHESLIAFSNHRYYGGGLVTFPSPVTSDRAVSLHLVEGGVYDKGGSRTNQVEAKAVVADIVDRLTDRAFADSGKSIGVVTFNSQQQKLIEDLLDEERRHNPALDQFFRDDQPEPVFVKNLENVQGDERDLMYFSITYGPDLSGRVSMNFGPLNKDGGERRLNVAVTRARHELKVFASLPPDQIDLSRTKAKGVADLKLFLEYARRGVRALAEEATAPRGDFDSPFEEIVAEALSRRGWTVHPQVGVSVFRIDLGVVDPDRPGAYLAGVECDGASYHRAATARDRDKLREQVLRGLGWAIVRTWSTDWWHDSESAATKLDARLQAILEQAKSQKKREAKESAQREAAQSKPKKAVPDDSVSESPGRPNEAAQAPPTTVVEPSGAGGPASAGYAGRSAASPATAAQPGDDAKTDLLADGNEAALAAAIRSIVAAEGPIRDDVLARRIAKWSGFHKAGARIREKVWGLAQREFRSVKEEGEIFFWPAGSTPGQWDQFRASVGEETRSADEICQAELVALAREVASTLLPEEDPVVKMAQVMGLRRLHATTRERLAKAWELRH